MIIRPINKVFKVNNTWYTVKLSKQLHSCIGCILYTKSIGTCEKDLDSKLHTIFGTCLSPCRKDNKDVIFVKIKE